MTKDAPAFDFYPERFWYAVEGWTDPEICRYWRLLGHQWNRDGLPESRKEMEGLARGKLTDRVFAKFPLSEDGKRRNPFMETLRNAQRERIKIAKEKSQRMHAARYKDATRTATSSDQALLMHCPPPTSHLSPLSLLPPSQAQSGELFGDVEKQTNTKKSKQDDSEFHIFWSEYPNKKGKAEAIKSWNKLNPDITTVLKALLWQKKSQQWTDNGGQYIPMPATYLNQKRWEDEQVIVKPKTVTSWKGPSCL